MDDDGVGKWKWKMENGNAQTEGGAGDLFPEGWQIIYSAAAEEEENTRFLSHSMHAFIQSFPLPCLGASSIQHTYKKTVTFYVLGNGHGRLEGLDGLTCFPTERCSSCGQYKFGNYCPEFRGRILIMTICGFLGLCIS